MFRQKCAFNNQVNQAKVIGLGTENSEPPRWVGSMALKERGAAPQVLLTWLPFKNHQIKDKWLEFFLEEGQEGGREIMWYFQK